MKVIRKGDEKEKIKRDMGIVECGWCNKEFSKEDINSGVLTPEFVFNALILEIKVKR